MTITTGTEKQIAWAKKIAAEKNNVANIEEILVGWLIEEELSDDERATLTAIQSAVTAAKSNAVFWIEDREKSTASAAGGDIDQMIEWIVDGKITPITGPAINKDFVKRRIDFTV